MIESYQQSVEEFKRVDHLFYVTLKYTRTVDVIRSTIERLITTYEHAVDSLLKILKEEKRIEDLPESPVGKANLLLHHLDDEKHAAALRLYMMLRKLRRHPYTRREEFRRHVTMIVDYDGEQKEVTIDVLKEYYDQVRDFLNMLRDKVMRYHD